MEILQLIIFLLHDRYYCLQEHLELKLSSHGRKMAKFRSLLQRLKALEVTITLDDVASLLHLPIVRAFHSFKQLHVDDTVNLLVELLETKIEACHWIVAARAYLLHLLGCTLFANKSVTHVHAVFLDALRDLTQSETYAWGTVALCWIYEHFPSVGSALVAEDYDERRSPACQWTSGKALPVSTYRRRLDRLTLDVVCWISYDDHCSFRKFEMGSLDDHSLTGENCTIVWVHLDYSATSYYAFDLC
ncbi:hypothetical protein HKD37_18G050200 [Glycine soja]